MRPARPSAVRSFEEFLKPRLERGQRIETLETGRPQVRASVERAERFLGLTALLAAVLAGVAIALGTRRFVERHLDGCAVMRCLGATQRRLVTLYGLEFTLLGVAACAVGVLLGLAAQQAIGAALAELLRAELPPPGVAPAVQGFLVGLVLLLGFALPPLLRLKNVPAVRVMRRETNSNASSYLSYLAGAAAFGGLLIWQAGDLKLGGYVVGGFAAAVLVFFAVAWAALKLLTRPTVARAFGPRLRYGLTSLRRHARGNAVQVAALALGLTAVLLLSFTRNDLVEAWRRSAPPDAPNRFLVGVQPDQLAEVQKFFQEKKLAVPELYPMVRGRLVAVNGRPVSEADYEEERAKRLVEREFNLSYMESLPEHNAVTAGRWLDSGGRELSVEQGIAERLGWRLGDELSWNVGGETVSRAHHLVPEAPLGLDEGELLRHRAAARARGLADELRERVPHRAGRRSGAERAFGALSEHHHRRCRRGRAPGAGGGRPAGERCAVHLSLRARRRAPRALLGARRHRGRAPARSRGDAGLRGFARPGHPRSARRVPRYGGARRASSRRSAPPRSARSSRGACSSSTCRRAPSCGSPARSPASRCSRSTPGFPRARCCAPRRR